MASIDRGIELSGWSDDLRDMIRRRVSESGGLALITLSALIAVALATWSVQDPSLSHATKAPVRNLLGAPGAVVADVLMQLLGVAAIALMLPVAVWGWRAGTDADESGVTVHALFGARRLPWSRISGFAPRGRRVVAVLDGGATVPLTAVTPADLPRLVAASGAEIKAQ